VIIGITTAPRPSGTNYLPKTVQSVLAAGGEGILVFAEPGCEAIAIGDLSLMVFPAKERLGNWRNWMRASEKLIDFAKHVPDTKYILTCEDDIVFSSKFHLMGAESILDALQGRHADSTGPLLLYTSSAYQGRMRDGIRAIDSRSLCGSCAMLWPVEALERVVGCDLAKNWRGIGGKDSGADIMHSDTCIGLSCNALGLKVFAMRPCPVQHVGEVSSLHEGPLCKDMFASCFEK
jgi:hypothetical protein